MKARAQTRRRQESAQSIDDLAPVEELSSWLGDDVCANCNGPTLSNHLYCSQQCKDEDAKAVSQAVPMQASTSAPARPASTKTTSTTPPWQANNEAKFRYVCPPSPNIVAKYKSALTSPALVALERSLPNTTSMPNQADRDARSVSSSGESSSVNQAKSKRRSSSRSTFSSASEVLSIDHGTPSSASDALSGDDNEDVYGLDASDFFLPPSIHPAASMHHKTAAREPHSTVTPSPSVTPDGTSFHPLLSKGTPVAHRHSMQSKASAKVEVANETIAFARRPSTTNLPRPAITSPLLSASTIKSSGRRTSGREASRRRSSGNTRASMQGMQASLARRTSTPILQERPLLQSASYSSPASVQKVGHSPASSAVPMVCKHIHHHQQRSGSAFSPPYVASASSSAGKTLRAASPDSNDQSFTCQAVCGRFGCSGTSSSVELVEQDSELIKENISPHRPSIIRGHKHTHSAAAGLNLLSSKVATNRPATSKLLMTPVGGAVDVKTEEREKQSSEQQVENLTESLDDRVKSPPRGRSKARGGRSSSRRSPSPPRGASRGSHSKDVTKERNSDKSRSRSIASVHSQTKSLVQRGRAPPEHGSSDDIVEERRGRSPTERTITTDGYRGRQREHTTSTVTPTKDLFDMCEMAWPAYGHNYTEWDEMDKSLVAEGIKAAIRHGSKGYDDVDLDEL